MTLTAAAVMGLLLVGLIQARQSLGDGAGEVFGALAGSGETRDTEGSTAAADGRDSAVIEEPTRSPAAEGSGAEGE
ncbi:MAG: hypothetical protein ACI81R_000166 [Bradymonadia bacterium]|jgi:hypothetical protein